MVAVVNGLLFGVLHSPDWDLTVVTIVAGSVWSWYYLRDRYLPPITVSHAGARDDVFLLEVPAKFVRLDGKKANPEIGASG